MGGSAGIVPDNPGIRPVLGLDDTPQVEASDVWPVLANAIQVMTGAPPTPPLDLRADFSRFRAAHGDRAHFAAHSHHFWPDATREAQLRYWDDSAERSDEKWEHVLGTVWTEARERIARHLRLPDPATLVPAPNTHELLGRLLSCLPLERPGRILTTDGEFHSFQRQTARLEEEGIVEVLRVATQPFTSVVDRLAGAASRTPAPDMVYLSQVFFDSGFAIEPLEPLVDSLWAEGRIVVIDGYHGFLARPTDLSAVAGRVFYIGGGYKYAMAGEGACFMHCPPGVAMRPRDTGWYAGFGALAGPQGAVAYPEDGWRFMGATFDPSGLYRLRASLEWLEACGLDARVVHAHARSLQDRFVGGLGGDRLGPFAREDLLVAPGDPLLGNFLTFRHDDAGHWCTRLRRAGVVVDARADRLRVGFGLYQSVHDVDRLLERLAGAI